LALMESQGAVIAARLHEWGALDLPVERAVFGTARPEDLAAAVDDWCREHLGAPIERYEFFESSSGSVHGVVLRDGRSVVVKGHRSTVTRDYLVAVRDVQAALAASGYPAPSPLAGPVAVGGGHVTAEVMLDRSPGVDGHDPGVRAALALGLAQFIDLSRPHRDRLGRVAHPMRVPDGALYPTPHSPRFDFGSTARGAEWIDTLRSRATKRFRSSTEVPGVVVHGDWRIENLGVRGRRLVGVFDWDSVHVAAETTAVAIAATTFSVDWNQPNGRRFPSVREIGAFVSDYEAARGDFTSDECDLLAATMVASLAYGARCEHADSGQPPTGDDSQRGLLSTLGEALLLEGMAALRG
jgi:Ser/Thr protein kinase RdoA (MazF antagonist)